MRGIIFIETPPPANHEPIATAFVDVVTKYNAMNKDDLRQLMNHEIAVLFNLVQAAGFNPKRIDDGHINKHGFTSNVLNPDTHKIVIDQDDEEDQFATGWLNQMTRVVKQYSDRGGKSLNKIAMEIIPEIVRSIPLKPIPLTTYGDMLGELPPTPSSNENNYFVEHVKEDSTFNFDGPIGVHLHCGGEIDLKPSSKKHNVLLCRTCQLRVPVCSDINSFEKLRALSIG